MSARWRLVPIPTEDNGRIVFRDQQTEAMEREICAGNGWSAACQAMLNSAPKASEDETLAKAITDKIITEFAGQDVIWVGDVQAIVASVLKLLEGAQ